MKLKGWQVNLRKGGIWGFSALAFCALVLSWLFYLPSGWTQAKPVVRISIATGGTGGIYYVMGGGIAALVSKYIPGVEATGEVTAASVDNCKLIMARKAEVAFAGADSVYDAYIGIGPFKSAGKMPLRTLAALYPAVSQIVTVEGTGINTVQDLKGKRVSTAAPGSGSELMALRILEAVGLDPRKDIRRERLSVGESTGAIKDRKIDAFFWAGGVPTAAVMDLGSTPGIKIKLIAHDDLIEKISKKYGPLFFRWVIPKEAYPGMTEPVPTIVYANILFCHEQLEERIAYGVVKTIIEHREELMNVHKEAEKLTLETAVKGSPIPFHPGAIKYYKERRAWKE
jgi:TRAP transporter TAXI family solute receptor